MESESIGSVSVSIVGDYSKLEGDIDKATQIAVDGGKEIADALNQGADGADALSSAISEAANAAVSFESQIEALVSSGSTLAEALEQVQGGMDAIAEGAVEVGAAAGEAAVQMDLFDESIMVPYAEAAGQLNLFATELEPIPAAAESAAGALAKLAEAETATGEEAKNAAPEVEGVAKSSEGLLGQMALLGAALGGVAMLVSLGKAAIEAGDAIGDATYSMGLLSGSAEDAARTVEELRDVADDAALGMPELLTAATRMTVFLGSSKPVPDILRAVADSASVMNKSLDAVAGSFERLVASSEVSKRALLNLGLTMADVGKVMGAAGDDINKAWEDLDQTARAEILLSALNKFAGAAKVNADDIGGDFVRLKNRVMESLEVIGNAIDPILRVLAKVATELLGSLERQAIALSAAVKSAIEGAKALFAAIGGNYNEAITHFQGMTAAWAKGNTELEALAAKHKDLNKVIVEGTHLTDAEIKAQVQAALARKAGAEGAKEFQKVLESLSKTAKDFASQLPASYEAYTAQLVNGGKTAQSVLSGTEDAIRKANLAMEGMRGKPLAAMQAVVDKLTEVHDHAKAFADEDSWNKAAQKVSDFAKKYEDELVNLDAATLDWVNAQMAAARAAEEVGDQFLIAAERFGAVLKAQAEVTKESKKIDKEYADAIKAMAKATREYNNESLEAVTITKSLHEIFPRATVAALDYAAAVKAAGIDTVTMLEAQITKNRELLALMEQFLAPIGQRLAMQQQILKEEIELKELTGISATAQILASAKINLQQRALIDSTSLYGDTVVKVGMDALHAFENMGGAIWQSIKASESLGQAFVKVGEQILDTTMTTIINAALRALVNEIVKSVIPTIASTVPIVKTVSGSLIAMQGTMHTVTAAMLGDIAAINAAFGTLNATIMVTAGAASGAGVAMATAVAAIVGAISGIIGNFQMYAMNKSLDIIVNHTLRIFNVLDQWYVASQDWFGQLFTRIGEIWRDMVAGFDDVVNALGGQRGTGGSGGGGGGGGGRPGSRPPGDTRPGDGRQPDPTYPVATPPPVFTIPGTPFVPPKMMSTPQIPGAAQLGGPGAGTYSSSTQSASSIVGGITFNVSGANDPRETARQIAETLKRVSPNFAAYS